jgi:two-component system LytT family response regulator
MLLHQLQHNENKFKKIAIPTSEGFERIPVDQILYCEANKNYSLVFLKNNRKMVACRYLKEVEGQLQHFSCFLRYIIPISLALIK